MFGPRHLHRLDLIVRALRPLPPSSRVLDAACGLGRLIERLHRNGFRAIGVDGELRAAIEAKTKAGVPVVVADMTRLPFRSGAFDAVTSGETLEHLDDDEAGAQEIGRLLRSGGRCVITVPALQALWTSSDDYYEHRRRYSRAALRALLKGAGLRIESLSFWGFPIVLAYDTLFLLPMNKRRARSGEAISAVARAGRSQALVAVVKALFGIDRLFSWIPFGPGLIAVARKE